MSIKGKVVWWNYDNGFGSIAPIDGSEEIYVHRSELLDCKRLHKGQYVRFEIGTNDKGRCARKVRLMFNAEAKANTGAIGK